jgi:hypothetical protein
MAEREDIDQILKHWPFDPSSVTVRKLWVNSRQVLQLRLDLGLLQMEVKYRPDGKRPHGSKTYLDYLKRQLKKSKEKFVLTEEQRSEIDREFVQFYHRRICWLHLHEFERAVEDADHTLQLMDLGKRYSPDEEWTISHEQYRPFVLYHRTQAAALALIESGGENYGEKAIDEINQGLEKIRQLFVRYEAEEQYQEDELVQQLITLRDNLRNRFDSERSLRERLAEAIAAEDYEQAAQIRDQLTDQPGV